MNLTQKKAYYNLCSPYKENIDDKYILDIDEFKIDGRELNIRGKNCANDIVTQISWSNTPQSIYFTGYTGSGKTTELKKILTRLESSEEGNLLPIYINIVDYFDINSPLDLSDILTMITYKVIVEVGKYQGKSEAEIFGENDYFGRLWHWLRDTNISLDAFDIDIGGTNIMANLKEIPQFRKILKESINDNFFKYKRDIIEELEKINEVFKRYEKDGVKKDGIVVVIDQLEKNRGTSANVDEVKEAIEKVFANIDNLTLPINVIYTIPPYLSIKIKDIYFLPVVKVMNKEDIPNQDGIEVMKALIYKRVPKDALEEILGDDYIYKLEYIIKATCGYPRDLLKVMQSVIADKSYPLSIENINKFLKDIERVEQKKSYNYINTIKINNYFSIKDIKLENLEGKREIYFVGENGDGKTILLQALALAYKDKSNYPILAKKYIQDISKQFYFNIENKVINDNLFAYGINRNKIDVDNADESGYAGLFDTPSLQETTFLRRPQDLLIQNTTLIKDFITKIEKLLENRLKIEVVSNKVIFSEQNQSIEFKMLSEGYKSTIIWLCDLLSRLVQNQPNINKLKDFKAVVLVDEIDLYLHPKWKYQFVHRLREMFPNIQFIMTTHSITTILGARDDAVFYQVYKDEEGLTRLSGQIDDISDYSANILITSPMFNMQSAKSRAYDDSKNSLSDDDYKKYQLNKNIDEMLSSDGSKKMKLNILAQLKEL